MLTPKIDQIYQEKDGYYVYLGEGRRYFFRNKQIAKEFLTKVGHFYKEKLFVLNEKYAEIYAMYRNYYMVWKKSLEKNTLTEKFRAYQEQFDLIFKMVGPNKDVFITRKIEYLYQELFIILEAINSKAHERGDTPFIYKVKAHKRVLEVEYESFYDLMQLIEQGANYEEIRELLIA